MKILIFASPRSGSTALTDALSRLFNIKRNLEPFNPLNTKGLTEDQINTIANNIPDNTVVKVLSVHRPRKWYLNFINQFDKVIYLTRADMQAAIESFHYAYNHIDLNESGYPDGSKWHIGYTFNSSNVTMDKWITEHIDDCIEEVKTVAYINKKSYIIYEDLFSEDINTFNKTLDYIDLDIDKIKLRELLHPSKSIEKLINLKL